MCAARSTRPAARHSDMRRTIVGFVRDDAGDWVAELSCLHSQHVRHAPPFRLAPWVLEEAQRSARIGSPLDCPLCDRAEFPAGLRVVGTSEVWDEHTVPAVLRRTHRLRTGVWGRLQVEQGQLRLHMQTCPPLAVIVGPDASQAIPPEVEHRVELTGPVRFFVESLRR